MSAELQDFWKGIGSLVNDDGRIDLLSCGLVSSEAGNLLLSQLESVTGKNFAASDNPTGNIQYGGDWVLESDGVDVAKVYFSEPALDNFTGLLVNSPPVLSLSHDAGSLDPTFSGDGKLTTAIGGKNDYASSMGIQADGKIVVAGYTDNGSNYDFALVRYNTDGSLDTSFSGDGKLTTDFGSNNDYATSLAIQTDGKIVVAGDALIGSTYCFALARYNSDGSLDTTFDSDGKLTTIMGGSDDWAQSAAIQADGKIVVAGYVRNGSNYDFALARYTNNGTLDATFDGDGRLISPITSYNDFAYSMVIQSDGKIVVGGQAVSTSADSVLARYTSNGTLDTTFDYDGKLISDIGGAGSEDRVMSVAIQSDGKIIAAGFTGAWPSGYFALARYTSNGSVDTSFGNDGKLTTANSVTGSSQCVGIQADGKIVLAGISTPYMLSSVTDFALARYTSNGTLGVCRIQK